MTMFEKQTRRILKSNKKNHVSLFQPIQTITASLQSIPISIYSHYFAVYEETDRRMILQSTIRTIVMAP